MNTINKCNCNEWSCDICSEFDDKWISSMKDETVSTISSTNKSEDDGFITVRKKVKRMLDKECFCKECHVQFIFTIKQQIKYKSLGWKEPKRCFQCKNT